MLLKCFVCFMFHRTLRESHGRLDTTDRSNIKKKYHPDQCYLSWIGTGMLQIIYRTKYFPDHANIAVCE